MVADRYRLQRKVGGGRVAATWQVHDEATQVPGVLKLLHRSMHHHPEALRRFSLEAQIARELNGPYFAERLDSGSWQSMRYIAWRWHQGECLRTRFERNPKQDAPTVCAVVKDVCEALSLVHSAGYTHADLKPENVFFAEGAKESVRQLKLLGFGVAFPEEPRQGGASMRSQERRRGHVVGTPLYMSPDMLRGDVPIGSKVDLWSLSVIVYEALTGRVPFLGSDLEETLEAILQRRAPRPSTLAEVPASLDGWWAQALAQDFTSAHEFAAALAKALEPALKSSRTQRSKLSPLSPDAKAPGAGAKAADDGAKVAAEAPIMRGIDVVARMPPRPDAAVARAGFAPLPTPPSDFLSSAKRTLLGIKPAQLDNKPRPNQQQIEAQAKAQEAVTLYRNIEISEAKDAITPANDHRTVPFPRPQLVPLGGFVLDRASVDRASVDRAGLDRAGRGDSAPMFVDPASFERAFGDRASVDRGTEPPPRSTVPTVEHPRPAFLAGVERKHQWIAAAVVCGLTLMMLLMGRSRVSDPVLEQRKGSLKDAADEKSGFVQPFPDRPRPEPSAEPGSHAAAQNTPAPSRDAVGAATQLEQAATAGGAAGQPAGSPSSPGSSAAGPASAPARPAVPRPTGRVAAPPPRQNALGLPRPAPAPGGTHGKPASEPSRAEPGRPGVKGEPSTRSGGDSNDYDFGF